MKTMVVLNEAIHRQAKGYAARQGLSLSRLVEEGLRLRLNAPATANHTNLLPLPVFKGKGGLCQGVDLSDGRSVQEALDRDKPLQALR